MLIACIFDMVIRVMDGDYAVCKLRNTVKLPKGAFGSLTITEDEISLVCAERQIPMEEVLEAETGFSILKIEGQLDFSLVGVLAKISTILAKEKISIFCISTYNTDYVLVRKAMLADSVRVLKENDYQMV